MYKSIQNRIHFHLHNFGNLFFNMSRFLRKSKFIKFDLLLLKILYKFHLALNVIEWIKNLNNKIYIYHIYL